MKLQITPSSIASALSAVAVLVATNWAEIEPIFTQAKATPFFIAHPHLFAELVSVATIVMLVGKSIVAHSKPGITEGTGTDATTAAVGPQGVTQ